MYDMLYIHVDHELKNWISRLSNGLRIVALFVHAQCPQSPADCTVKGMY